MFDIFNRKQIEQLKQENADLIDKLIMANQHISDNLIEIDNLTSKLNNKTNNLVAMTGIMDKLESIIAKENTSLVLEATKLHISDHAIHRYKQRILKEHSQYNDPDEAIRQQLYKLLLRHLACTDKLSDGRYDLNRNVVCKVKDNTMVTVFARGKR